MKKYTAPEMIVTTISQDNIIMLSGVTAVQNGTDKPYGSITATRLGLNS